MMQNIWYKTNFNIKVQDITAAPRCKKHEKFKAGVEWGIEDTQQALSISKVKHVGKLSDRAGHTAHRERNSTRKSQMERSSCCSVNTE